MVLIFLFYINALTFILKYVIYIVLSERKQTIMIQEETNK